MVRYFLKKQGVSYGFAGRNALLLPNILPDSVGELSGRGPLRRGCMGSSANGAFSAICCLQKFRFMTLYLTKNALVIAPPYLDGITLEKLRQSNSF